MKSEDLLMRIKEGFQSILGNNLTGIYVHGSLAFGCFQPDSSDIDFIAVVRTPLEHDQKRKLIGLLVELEAFAPPKGLEMSIVLEGCCRHFVHPCPFELHYSKAHKAWAERDIDDYCRSMRGTDPDLAAHFTVIRTVGYSLCGSLVQEVFGEVSAQDYLSSIRYDVENAAYDIRTAPVYIILNLCRVAAYVQHSAVLSKKTGGEWGVKHLPHTFRKLISSALHAYTGDHMYQPNDEEEQAFVTYMNRFIFQKIRLNACNADSFHL